MPLDSDVAHADAQLQVTFYEYQEEGHFKGRLHVRIILPGNKLNIVDRLAREDDKLRFTREYLHFQMKNSEHFVVGTPLMVWRQERPEELTDGQLQEMLILKFQSVEQLAMAADAQIQRMGMGAAGIRERARSYLASKNAQASGAELSTAKSEIETLKAQMAAILASQQAPVPNASKPRAKRGGYRPRKNKVTANVKHNDAAVGAASS